MPSWCTPFFSTFGPPAAVTPARYARPLRDASMLAPDGAAHFRLVRDAEAGHAGRPLIPQGNIEVGRQDAGPSFKHVSRVQARLHQDGAAVRLESVGGHPTGMWGGPGTSWRWIPKGESCNLEAGAHVALGASNPPAHVPLPCTTQRLRMRARRPQAHRGLRLHTGA